MLRIVAGMAGSLLVGVGLVVAFGNWRWRHATAELDAAITDGSSGDRSPLEATPPPVTRYLARAIPPEAAPIRVARLVQTGTFQMGDGPAGWKPFSATEVFGAIKPSYYWDARIQVAPFLSISVRDSYTSGEGAMLGRLAGVLPVVDASGDRRLAEGALSRYLAEAVWFPTRLADGSGLSWTAIDANQAEATLTDQGITVSLRFTFAEDGDPIEVFGLRPREQDGDYIATPWLGRFDKHRDVGGFRIPTYGEVAWIIDGVEKPYWRGFISSAVYSYGTS